MGEAPSFRSQLYGPAITEEESWTLRDEDHAEWYRIGAEGGAGRGP